MQQDRLAVSLCAAALAAILVQHAAAVVPAPSWNAPAADAVRLDVAFEPSQRLDGIVNQPLNDADAIRLLRRPSVEDRMPLSLPPDFAAPLPAIGTVTASS